MTQDANHSKDHSGKIAVGIADEDTSWIAILTVKRHTDSKEREKEVEREEMRVGRWMRVCTRRWGGAEDGITRKGNQIQG